MQMRIQTLVAVVVTDKVRTPVLYGFLRPRILLPQGLVEAIGLEGTEYVFLHELAHLKRYDITVAWILSIIQVLHWFNPLVWLALHRMRADQETAADALALRSLTADEPTRYGRTIMRLLEGFTQGQVVPSVAGILEDTSLVERRIRMIAHFKNDSRSWSLLGIGVTVALGILSMIDPPDAGVSAAPAAGGTAGAVMRMVQKEVQDEVSTSPDGKYLCNCGTWVAKGIAIRELATGEQRTVKPTKAAPEEDDPEWPILSPDNKTIAYAANRTGKGVDICLIGVDGTGQRVLCHDLVRPVQWFPDGSRLLGLRLLWPKGAQTDIQIVSVSIADGSVQPIGRTLTGDFVRTRIRLSPDARTVAYELESKDDPNHWYGTTSAYDSKRHDIFAVEIDTQRETPLVVNAADDRLLDWTPDGQHLLFVSDRAGPWSAWLLPVAKGQAQGAPELAAQTMEGIRPVGFGENNTYYYRIRYSTGGMYVATVNLGTGQLVSGPVQLADGESPAWSPDGKYLAYRLEARKPSESRVIRIRTLATGQERDLPNKLTMLRCLRWSADGRSLIASDFVDFLGAKDMLQGRVHRFDVTTGETTLLLDHGKDGVGMAELSPDSKTLYYSLGDIHRRQIDTGQEMTVFECPPKGYACWLLSPNGESIAVGCSEKTAQDQWDGGVKKVLLIPSQGGQATQLMKWDQSDGYITDVCWARDGKSVLFRLHRDPIEGKNLQQVDEFWQVRTEGGGEARRIMETEQTVARSQGFSIHPDGQRIVFNGGAVHGELWTMEHLLPAGAGAKDPQ
jgi:Tol biopolymer transport system component